MDITNETAFSMMDLLPDFRNLQEISLILKGTDIEDLIAYKLTNVLDDKMLLRNKVIVI